MEPHRTLMGPNRSSMGSQWARMGPEAKIPYEFLYHFDLNLTNVPAAVTCPPIASVPLPWAHECARGSCVRGITLEGSVTEQRGSTADQSERI